MEAIKFGINDVLIDTAKVTAGFWSGGLGTIAAKNEATFITSSLSTTQKDYYLNIQYNRVDHLTAMYGHVGGSGSTTGAINAGVGETQAIYNSLASYFLPPNEIEDGFKIQSTASMDKDIYILVAERARMKDAMDTGNWTLAFSGSFIPASGGGIATGSTLFLTDDSKVTTPQISPAGPRHLIRSGSKGTLNAATTRYGFYYPDAGTYIFSAQAMSASLQGIDERSGSINGASGKAENGFAPDLTNDGTANNANKLFVAMKHCTENQVLRNMEEQTDVTYFCRSLAPQHNFSSNNTFISGSRGEYTHSDMEGNPQTFISTVALLSGGHNVVAVGRLSAPIKSNYNTENIIKVKLSY